MTNTHPRSLVIAPFDAAGRFVFDEVGRALRDVGVEVFNIENVAPGASRVNAITDAICSSNFLVVDISRQNPNVLYELGLAHAMRKPTILLVSLDAREGLPSDLVGFQYIVYDPSKFGDLRDRIQHAVRAFIAKSATNEE